MKRRLTIAGWITIGAAIVLGALGYLQELLSWPLPKGYTLLLLSSFLLISVTEILLDRFKAQHSAEDFYEAEVTEVFPRGTSEPRIQFFTEKGKKCVALTLKQAAIPNSVRLWEGGYNAPAFTFVVKNNVVVFLNSAFASQEEYITPGPIYSVRYFPAASNTAFAKPVQ